MTGGFGGTVVDGTVGGDVSGGVEVGGGVVVVDVEEVVSESEGATVVVVRDSLIDAISVRSSSRSPETSAVGVEQAVSANTAARSSNRLGERIKSESASAADILITPLFVAQEQRSLRIRKFPPNLTRMAGGILVLAVLALIVVVVVILAVVAFSDRRGKDDQ